MMCGQSYQRRYKEQRKPLHPQGGRDGRMIFFYQNQVATPEEEVTWPESWLWMNKNHLLKMRVWSLSGMWKQEHSPSLLLLVTLFTWPVFCWNKKKIPSASDSDHWSLTFRLQQGKDRERDLGWCEDRVSLLCLNQAPSLSLNTGDGKQWAQQTRILYSPG